MGSSVSQAGEVSKISRQSYHPRALHIRHTRRRQKPDMCPVDLVEETARLTASGKVSISKHVAESGTDLGTLSNVFASRKFPFHPLS